MQEFRVGSKVNPKKRCLTGEWDLQFSIFTRYVSSGRSLSQRKRILLPREQRMCTWWEAHADCASPQQGGAVNVIQLPWNPFVRLLRVCTASTLLNLPTPLSLSTPTRADVYSAARIAAEGMQNVCIDRKAM